MLVNQIFKVEKDVAHWVSPNLKERTTYTQKEEPIIINGCCKTANVAAEFSCTKLDTSLKAKRFITYK